MDTMFSFIVPVYNTRDYLDICVGSLLMQKETKSEIILVDDGSTDGSSGLCDRFAAAHANVRTVHKQNGGQSSARNLGIELCGGKYAVFVDSDDMLENDITSDALDAAKEDPDVILSSGYSVSKGNSAFAYDFGLDANFRACEPRELLRRLLAHENKGALWLWPPWNGLYKTDFLRENGLYFKSGIYAEDALWTPSVMLAAKKVAVSASNAYVYRRREGSTTSGCSPKLFFDFLGVVEYWYGQADSLDPPLAKAFRVRFADEFTLHYLPHVMSLGDDDRISAVQRVLASGLLDNVSNRRLIPFAAVMRRGSVGSFMLGARMLNAAYRIKNG